MKNKEELNEKNLEDVSGTMKDGTTTIAEDGKVKIKFNGEIYTKDKNGNLKN